MPSTSIQQFFVVIHGETEAHTQNKLCGSGWDLPLNEEGLKQAKKLARVFANDKQGIRIIFSSPMLRTIQTTDVIHDTLKVKVRVISGLAERNLGQWEKGSLEALPGFSESVEQIPGGESLNRFKARVQESIDYVLDSAAATGGAALMITHGLFGQILLGQLSLAGSRLERCQLYRFWRELPSGAWQMEQV